MSDMNKILPTPLTDKCIVLDLDETLVHTCSDSNIDLLKEMKIFTDPKHYELRQRIYKITMEDVVHKKGTGDKTEMWGIMRPFLREFLIFCFSYFKIVICWSAGRRGYVHTIIDQICVELKRPIVVWCFDDLERLSDSTFIKPLTKMINKVPGLNKHMSLENTFIVDDRTSVFREPNPYNGIEIPAYKPEFTLEGLKMEDKALKTLSRWFLTDEVKNCKDVRKLDKSMIFK